MNILHLQKHAAVLAMLKQVGSPFIVGAKLLPSQDYQELHAMLWVNNVYRDRWLDEEQMIGIVNQVGHMADVPLRYAGHVVVGRELSMFKPFTDVEVFVTWQAQSQDDELIQSKSAAQGLSMIDSNGRPYLWGWLPGHVLEAVNNTVKVKTARPVWNATYSGDQIITVPWDAQWLRITRMPQEILQGGHVSREDH